MKPVTDPNILRQLNGGAKPVTDPDLLRQLNGPDLTKGGYMTGQPSILGSETLGNFFAGGGEGLLNMYHGAKQIGGKLGLLDLPADFEQDVMARAKAYESSPAGRSTAGKTGEVVGAALPFVALPGGPVGLMGKAAWNAGLGTVAGGLQFVPPGGSRATNAAVGGTVGAVAGPVLDVAGTAGVKGVNALRGRMRPEAQELNALSRQFDVPLSVGDISRGPVQPKVETALGTVPFVGMGGFRQKQGQAAQRAAETMQKRFAVGGDPSKMAQESLERRFVVEKDKADQLFTSMSNQAGADVVPTSKMNKIAQDMIDQELKRQPGYRDTDLINFLKPYVDDPQEGFMGLRNVNTELSEVARSFKAGNAAIGKRGSVPIRRLQSALDNDMESFAKQKGGTLFRDWKSYNKQYRENVRPFEDERDIRAALKARDFDEILPKFLKPGRRERAEALYRRMDDDGRKAAQAWIMDNAMAKGLDSKTFSLNKYAGYLEDMSEPASVFFPKSDKQAIDGLAKLLRRAEKGGQYLEDPPTGARLANMVGASVGTVGGSVGLGIEPMTIATSAAMVKALSVLYTSRVGKRILLSASKAKGGQLDKLLQRAARLAAVESARQISGPRVEIGTPQMVR